MTYNILHIEIPLICGSINHIESYSVLSDLQTCTSVLFFSLGYWRGKVSITPLLTRNILVAAYLRSPKGSFVVKAWKSLQRK